MSDFIPAAAWAKYKATLRKAADSFNKDTLTWIRGLESVGMFQEQTEMSGDAVQLNILINYNYFRSWPITRRDQAGEQDNENMVVLINKKYLKELGYLTPSPNEYFNFQPDNDFFIHRGIRYKSEGDTFISQAGDDPQFIQLILHREEILVGDKRFDAKVPNPVIIEAEVDILKIIQGDDL